MTGWSLGLKASWRDPAMLLFATLGLAASLAPILIIWGLKSGLVESMLGRLRDDPANLAIVFQGDGVVPIDDAEIARLRAMPGANFVEPMTRSLTTRVQFEAPQSRALITSDLLPTGEGEPLLPQGARSAGAGEVVLSEGLAAKLGLAAGHRVLAIADRRAEAGIEEIEFELAVVDIVPAALDAGDRAYVVFAMMDEIEAFRDGYDIRGRGGRPLSERSRLYGSVRFYARSLEDIERLDAALTARGYRVASQAHRVQEILTLDRNLTTAFGFIAGTAALGFAISFGATIAGNLSRLRRHLSLVRLMGAPMLAMITFPLAQAMVVTALGLVAAVAAYQAAAWIINRVFASDLGGAPVCTMPLFDLVAACLATALIAVLAAIIVARRYAAIAPAEVLHAD